MTTKMNLFTVEIKLKDANLLKATRLQGSTWVAHAPPRPWIERKVLQITIQSKKKSVAKKVLKNDYQKRTQSDAAYWDSSREHPCSNSKREQYLLLLTTHLSHVTHPYQQEEASKFSLIMQGQ